MPSLSTMVYPAPGYVRVETNWGDVGQAVRAAVYRVDCLTGERVPLRPYVSFSGEFLDLSCGYGIFWDTEAPLDRCVYYCTQGQDAAGLVATAPAAPLLLYTFTTAVVNGWGPADTGQTFTLSGGTVPGDYDVTAGAGTQSNGVVNVLHHAWADVGSPDQDVYLDVMAPQGTAVGAPIRHWLFARLTDVNNYYAAILDLGTAGDLTLRIVERVAGVLSFTTTTAIVGVGHVGGDWWSMRFQVWGTQLKAKAWLRTGPEPDWQLTATDSSLTSGNNVGAGSRLETGNGNGLPVVLSFDNLRVVAPCAEPVVIEVCSDDVVVPSSGEFRLGDPMRPCNDVTLQLTPNADPDCVPTQGIFFASMSDEDAEANSGTFAPVNSVYPIGIYRARRSLTATLTLLARTFADRDAMRQLNAPGGPLLLRGPAQYGIEDRYMLVGNVTEHRGLSDHRVQPRAVVMPHVQLDYPYGPSQGICGARVEDLCDIYSSWDAVVAAGLTYADLLRGRASNDTPIPDTVERTWAQVNALYASWNAAKAANSDWDTLREGT